MEDKDHHSKEEKGPDNAAKGEGSARGGREGQADSRSKHSHLKWKWGWLNAGFVVALVGLLGAILPHYLGNAPTSELQLDSMTVESYAEAHPIAASNGETGPVAIDFKLRNLGDQLALITAVNIEVKSVKFIPPIFTSSILPSSATYGFVLPLRANAERTVVLNEQIGPDQADRFLLDLRLPSQVVPGAEYIYRIRFLLLYNRDSSINTGYRTIAFRGWVPLKDEALPFFQFSNPGVSVNGEAG